MAEFADAVTWARHEYHRSFREYLDQAEATSGRWWKPSRFSGLAEGRWEKARHLLDLTYLIDCSEGDLGLPHPSPRAAWDTLLAVAQQYRRGAESMPVPLQRWLADVAAGRKPPRKISTKRRAREAWIRDVAPQLEGRFPGLPRTRRGSGMAGSGRSVADVFGTVAGKGYKSAEGVLRNLPKK